MCVALKHFVLKEQETQTQRGRSESGGCFASLTLFFRVFLHVVLCLILHNLFVILRIVRNGHYLPFLFAIVCMSLYFNLF